MNCGKKITKLVQRLGRGAGRALRADEARRGEGRGDGAADDEAGDPGLLPQAALLRGRLAGARGGDPRGARAVRGRFLLSVP